MAPVLNPLVSIIIPAYNHQAYITYTIASLISQTYVNSELIVIDDGSTDGTRSQIEALRKQCEERFTRFVFIAKPNEGLMKTLNLAISLANGEYVFLIASDDTVEAEAIETLVEEMNRDPNIGLACGDADFINEAGASINLTAEAESYRSFVKYHTREKREFDVHRDFGSYSSLLSGNYVPVGLLLRRAVFEKVGTFQEDILIEDLAMWFHLAKHYRMKFVDKTLAHYRIHSANTIRVFRDRILVDTVRLYIREQAYCREHNQMSAWNERFALLLYLLARRGRLFLFLRYVRYLGLRAFLARALPIWIWPALKKTVGL